MPKFDIKAPLINMVADADGPDDINDPVCFIIGYCTGEIRRRIAELDTEIASINAEMERTEDSREKLTLGDDLITEVSAKKHYEARLLQVEKAWAAFTDATPSGHFAAEAISEHMAGREAYAASTKNS